MDFITVLKDRNALLFWFGLANLVLTLIMIVFSYVKPIEFGGANAWFKPIKFALSIGILSWTMCWYTGYLIYGRDIALFNWIFTISLAFEIVYITFQASKGQGSHFNLSTPYYSLMYSLMAIGATVATLSVGYIGIKFFTHTFSDLPNYYLWSIRLGFILFVIFSFEGFAMGASLKHTVGGEDGSAGIPFFNWSKTLGDLRVAHFFGMHAIQVLPIISYYLLKDIKLTFALFVLYSILAFYVLIQALNAKPFLKM